MMLYTNPLYDEMVKRSVRIRDDVQAVVNQNPGLNRWQISEHLAFTDAREEEVMDALSTLTYLGRVEKHHNGRCMTYWPPKRRGARS